MKLIDNKTNEYPVSQINLNMISSHKTNDLASGLLLALPLLVLLSDKISVPQIPFMRALFQIMWLINLSFLREGCKVESILNSTNLSVILRAHPSQGSNSPCVVDVHSAARTHIRAILIADRLATMHSLYGKARGRPPARAKGCIR